ncbi:MAG: histone deacetylase [Chitinivibrionales bacterium]|nr:histone deacetylase [Chitinivibrionales bacterium]
MLLDTGLMDELPKVHASGDEKEILDAVRQIHSDDHIESVLAMDITGNVAPLAVAAVLAAVRAVAQGELTNAFCAVRPPGHHAHNNGAHYEAYGEGQGFCFLNNIAIAARYAQRVCGFRNILILDWDFHHGNGTEWAFYHDPTVFFFSTHALYTYPGTGFADRNGAGGGLGYNLSIPLDFFSGDREVLHMWETRLFQRLDELDFKPDFVLVSAGFDSREKDYLGNFQITDTGFVRLTEIALDIARTHSNKRLVSILEGGYNPQGLASAVNAHLNALQTN